MSTRLAIQECYRKLERQHEMLRGAQAMRQSTDNPAYQQTIDVTIREAQRNIDYLEEKLQSLELKEKRVVGSGADEVQSSRHTSENEYDALQPPPVPEHGPLDGLNKQRRVARKEAPPPPPKDDASSVRNVQSKRTGSRRQNLSKLDLIRYDTPLTTARISLMLQQLEFKLGVEKQYRDGIDKMSKLYARDGDRRSIADTENKRMESNQKMQLLKQALKRYTDLHVGFDDDETADDDQDVTAPNMRRPLSGKLIIRVHAVRDVEHASSTRFSRGPETFVAIKIEDALRGKSKISRSDRWSEEFEMDVEKANEIEITVFDRQNDRQIPVGMLWIRISDVAEEVRRRKVEQEIATSGWISADRMNNENSISFPGGRNNTSSSTSHPFSHDPSLLQPSEIPSSSGVQSWFSLEPAGQILLTLDFIRTRDGRRLHEAGGGLGRQGAIRQRKGEVYEKHGHKFVQQQFYQIMRCALCGELLKNAAGYQCEDCRYTCHKKCYPRVVTKCISKSSDETDPDEEKLNHRIPHRFEPLTNIGANWCCHCGYILPLGKKSARKCTECGVTCHAHCAHLVPDFCGMSMEMANQILSEIRSTKRQRASALIGDAGRKGAAATSRRKDLPSIASKSSAALPPSPRTSKPLPQEGLQQKMTEAGSPNYGLDENSLPAVASAKDDKHVDYFGTSLKLDSGGLEPQSERQTQSVLGDDAPQFPKAPLPPVHQQMGSQATIHQQQYQQQQQKQKQQQFYAQPMAQHQATKQTSMVSVPQQQQPQQPQQPQQVVLQQQQQQQQQQDQQHQLLVSQQRKAAKRVGLDDFNFLAVLGKGNFGKVMLAEYRNTRKLYAIKVLKKDFILEHEEVESTKSEKRVFLVANKERHPFLINLHSCFQTETRIYFVMEYVRGGDLMWHIQRQQFNLKRAQFYAAEVCLALKYFHENGIIYRDLKLDNILLCPDGHIKIADYGLCKEDMWYGNTTTTFCGTPEFMAPEILLEQKYTRAVDWWAFGVLIYQMLLGQSPFRGDDDEEIFEAILSDVPLYPIHMPKDSISILERLLVREPEKRLGSGASDAQEVMSHPFFKNINWDDVLMKRIQPPFTPTLTSETDVSNFDSEFTKEKPELTPVQSVLTEAMQEQFRGFSVFCGD